MSEGEPRLFWHQIEDLVGELAYVALEDGDCLYEVCAVNWDLGLVM